MRGSATHKCSTYGNDDRVILVPSPDSEHRSDTGTTRNHACEVPIPIPASVTPVALAGRVR